MFPSSVTAIGSEVPSLTPPSSEGKCFRIYLCMMTLATVNKGTFIYLQALGKAVASTVVSLTREIIFGVFLPILLPMFMGLDGLLWSFPVADVLTFVIALVFIRRTFRELSD